MAVKLICDKCGIEVSELNAYKPYSFSKHKEVLLCYKCLRKHDEAIEKADRGFFNKENKK